MRFQGTVFRAHNPQWAWSPVSGEGARRHGGRFNPIGQAALYTALSPLTAIREASPLGRPLEPLTLCAYAVDCDHICDTRDPAERGRLGISDDDLTCPDWEYRMLKGDVPASHALAVRLIDTGHAGLLVQSFARGAGPGDVNLVFWDWDAALPHRVEVIDTEGRLPRDGASWQ